MARMGMTGNASDSSFEVAYSGDFTRLQRIIEERKESLQEVDINNRMLIHWAAVGGHEQIIKYLLDSGSPVDPKDDMDSTPLILASSAGRVNVIPILLDKGADVNQTNKQGHSALQYACSKDWVEVVKLLLGSNANINVQDAYGASPLHRAASKGNITTVNLLLQHRSKLDIDCRDVSGNTSLHLACEEDRVEIALLLVSNGSDISARNKNKQTPLDMASRSLVKQLTSVTV